MTDDPRALLGSAIRKRRLKLGWSQQLLAEKADLHLTYVNEIENGKKNVGLINIVTLSRALGTNASSLLRGIE